MIPTIIPRSQLNIVTNRSLASREFEVSHILQLAVKRKKILCDYIADAPAALEMLKKEMIDEVRADRFFARLFRFSDKTVWDWYFSPHINSFQYLMSKGYFELKEVCDNGHNTEPMIWINKIILMCNSSDANEKIVLSEEAYSVLQSTAFYA